MMRTIRAYRCHSTGKKKRKTKMTAENKMEITLYLLNLLLFLALLIASMVVHELIHGLT
jgi:hypothetical protein